MYLVIKYYDNDFGLPVQTAARRLWSMVNDNNGHMAELKPDKHFSGKTTAQIFKKLHKAKVLNSLLSRLFVLAYLENDVEFITRGLYWSKVDWESKKIDNPNKIDYTNTYLMMDLTIRNTPIPKDKWENGEAVVLDLDTGETRSF